MKCVSYTRTIPWKNHKGELTIADQNQRIAEYLAEHKELNLQKRYSDRKNAENAGAEYTGCHKSITHRLNIKKGEVAHAITLVSVI